MFFDDIADVLIEFDYYLDRERFGVGVFGNLADSSFFILMSLNMRMGTVDTDLELG